MCDVDDGGPGHQVDLGDDRVVFFHFGCDPHPELDEDARTSQYRAAMETVGLTPTVTLNIPSRSMKDRSVQ